MKSVILIRKEMIGIADFLGILRKIFYLKTKEIYVWHKEVDFDKLGGLTSSQILGMAVYGRQ